jgi:hypothetical protein
MITIKIIEKIRGFYGERMYTCEVWLDHTEVHTSHHASRRKAWKAGSKIADLLGRR